MRNKEKYFNSRRKEQGITLVALVVTIIILLILAGVALNIALSENGIFEKAKEAVEKYKEAQKDELEGLYEIENLLSKTQKPKIEKVSITFDANGGNGKMEKIIVEKGEEVTLPQNSFTWEYHGFGKWNTNKDGNGVEYLNKSSIKVEEDTVLYAMWANYGDSVGDRYENIYTSFDSKNIIEEQYTEGSSSGRLANIYFKMNPPSENYINENQRGTSGQGGTTTYHTVIKNGENINNLLRNIKNKWTLVRFNGAYSSGRDIQISNFKLIFEDNKELTLKEAFENEYIEPLVLLQSKWKYLNEDIEYGWKNFNEIINGDSGLGDYPMGWIYFKVKDKSSLTGIKFNSNKDWYEAVDGFFVVDCGDLELSITPF